MCVSRWRMVMARRVRLDVLDPEPGQVLRDGIVELKPPCVPQLHDGRGREQLRHRGDPEQRRRRDRQSLLLVGKAVPLRPDNSWSYTMPIDSPGSSRDAAVA